MNIKEKRLLTNNQHLMKAHEKMIARWLVEQWDGKSEKVPGWIRGKVWQWYPNRVIHKPSELAREICIRLLKDHKHEISKAQTMKNHIP